MFAPPIAKAQTKAVANSNSKQGPTHSTRRAGRGVSWDFSKIPIFPSDRTTPVQGRPSLNTPSLPGVLQPKLAVGDINDPFEHEADRVAERVMRMLDHEAPTASSSQKISRKYITCENEKSSLRAKPVEKSVARGGREAPGIVHDVIGSSGQPLDLSARAMLEPRFGHDFSRVRIHTGKLAANSARAVGARAYTVGNDIVFGENQYRPHDGAGAGARLLAHELTHTIQQGGDAKQHSTSVVEAPLVQRDFSWPWEESVDVAGLRSTIHKSISDQSFIDMLEHIGTPQFHKAAVLNYVDTLDVDYIKRAVNLLGNRELSDIAGSAEGTEVMQHMLARLPPGATEHGAVESVLTSRTGPTAIKTAPVTPADAAAIDRINKAVSTDPHKTDYAAAKIPLRFPVEIYTAGRALDGGVYYDPNLTTAGETPVVGYHQSVTSAKGRTTDTHPQYPLLFIKLGPNVLSFTDTFIRATLFHEFVHYSRNNEFRGDETGKSAETKLLEQEVVTSPPGTPLDSHEIEATSKEIAEVGATMNNEEVTSNLLYLSRFIAGAFPDFKTQALDRIVVSARASGQVQRYIKLIDGLRQKAKRTALKPLRAALAAAPAKKKP